MRKIVFYSILMMLCVNASSGHAQKKMTDREIFAKGYILKDEQKKFVDKEYLQGTNCPVYTIEKGRKETKVTFIQPIYFDSQWIHYTKGFTIIDKKRGDEYGAIGYDNGIPMGQVVIVRGCNRRMIYITLIFPKLKNRVKVIDIIERAVEGDPSPSNSTGEMTTHKNLRLKDYLPKTVRKYEARRASGKINIYR